MPSHPCADDVADCVLETFDALPPKYKPRQLADGRREWVPLAGIVLSKEDRHHETNHDLVCAALATGMKCLPLSKVPAAKGNVLHDWHAEVLAMRGFNRWILDECAEGEEGGSEWIIRKKGKEKPFELREGVGIHMYCSEAPCGDASMELVMREQEDDTPWTSSIEERGEMVGRGYFDRLGIVRRKPARPDAPTSLSKSCSDKICLKQVTGLLGGVVSEMVRREGTYIDTLVLPEAQIVQGAVERAWGKEGRMRELGERMRAFEVRSTSREFAYSRRVLGRTAVPSNLSALWTRHRQEVLVNGVLQGRKQSDPKGASCVSRRMLWKRALEVAVMAGVPAVIDVLRRETYGEVKKSDLLRVREGEKQQAKEVALNGWKKNADDHDWGIDQES